MRTFHEALDKVKQTLETKQMGYGHTYKKTALALSVPPQYSILVRLFEKLFRIDHLLKTGSPAMAEEVAQEFLDVAGYAILGLFESSQEQG